MFKLKCGKKRCVWDEHGFRVESERGWVERCIVEANAYGARMGERGPSSRVANSGMAYRTTCRARFAELGDVVSSFRGQLSESRIFVADH